MQQAPNFTLSGGSTVDRAFVCSAFLCSVLVCFVLVHYAWAEALARAGVCMPRRVHARMCCLCSSLELLMLVKKKL